MAVWALLIMLWWPFSADALPSQCIQAPRENGEWWIKLMVDGELSGIILITGKVDEIWTATEPDAVARLAWSLWPTSALPVDLVCVR
jgi:hypothetical protein